MVSLDADKAPDLARNLRQLYCYMQQRLIEANLKQKDAPLEETGRLLSTLADAWQQVPQPRDPAEYRSRESHSGEAQDDSNYEVVFA
jgi:flagellar protein FliS